MKIMVTGFGRFLEHEANPTKEVLALLPKSIQGHQILTMELPVIFDECFTALKNVIADERFDVIIMLGLAGGRTAITPERIAINLKDGKLPDNVGNMPKDEVIIQDGPMAYLSTLPLRKIEERLLLKNIPVMISNTAGLYVCNNVFYHVMHYINTNSLRIKAGFIHVPYMDEQTKPEQAFSLPIDQILEAIVETIKTVIS